MLSEEQISQNRRNLSHSARTLSAIVVMYVVCNLPRLLLNTGKISSVLIGRPPTSIVLKYFHALKGPIIVL